MTTSLPQEPLARAILPDSILKGLLQPENESAHINVDVVNISLAAE